MLYFIFGENCLETFVIITLLYIICVPEHTATHDKYHKIEC